MKVDKLIMRKEKAEIEFKKYKQVAVKKFKKEQKLIKQIYNYLRKGKKIIDLRKSFEIAGLNEGKPRLAIARADWKKVVIEKYGETLEFKEDLWTRKSTIKVSSPIFEECDFGSLEAPLPYVPPYISIYNPKKFYILWEVEKWQLVQPKDPILLKKIDKNFYLICNFWHLTKVERRIMNSFRRT